MTATADEMREAAITQADDAREGQRLSFHARYGSFQKCGRCGAVVEGAQTKCWGRKQDPNSGYWGYCHSEDVRRVGYAPPPGYEED